MTTYLRTYSHSYSLFTFRTCTKIALQRTCKSHSPPQSLSVIFPDVNRVLQIRWPASRPASTLPGIWNIVSALRISITGQRSVLLALKTRQKFRKSKTVTVGMAPTPGFYAVAVGKTPGIYHTWADCEFQVKGHPGATYKKFRTEAEALGYIASSGALGPTQPPQLVQGHISAPAVAQPPVARLATKPLSPRLQELAHQGYHFTEGSPHHLVVYTDGSARGNGQIGSKAGAGVWWGSFGEASKHNWAERVPGDPQTNNRGELLAVIRALERCPFPDIPLEVRCDSKYTISCMTVWLPKWLDNNFRNSNNGDVVNKDLIKHLLVLLRNRGCAGRVRFKHVPAHNGIEGNEGADRLARTGGALPSVADTNHWLDPDRDDAVFSNAVEGPTSVDLEVDESWVMPEHEYAAFDNGLGSI